MDKASPEEGTSNLEDLALAFFCAWISPLCLVGLCAARNFPAAGFENEWRCTLAIPNALLHLPSTDQTQFNALQQLIWGRLDLLPRAAAGAG